MPGEYDAPIDSAQQEIQAQKSEGNADIIRQYEGTFFAEVDSFQALGQKINISTPEALIHLWKGKESVAGLLRQIAARGKWLLDEDKEKNKKKEAQTKPKKTADPGADIHLLASSLKSTLDKYRQNVQLISQIEIEAKEAEAKLSLVDALEMNEKQYTLAADKKDLDAALDDGLNRFAGLRKILTNSGNLPENFKAAKLQLAESALKKLVQKKIERDLQRLVAEKYSQYLQIKNGNTLIFNDEFKKLPEDQQKKIKAELVAVKIGILDQVEALSCPKIMENYWLGKKLFESGDFENCIKSLNQFIEKDVKSFDFQHDKNLKKSEAEYLATASEMVKKASEVSQENKDFLDGQALANSGDIIGAKAKLKKYVAEHEGKSKEGSAQNFVGSAKELLTRIAKIQLEQVKAKFAAIEVPPEKIIKKAAHGEVTEIENPEFKKYQSYKKGLQQIEVEINSGKYLDFADAANAVKASIPGFDPNDKFNFIADEIKEDEGRKGLLELARKYRKNGQYDLAEECFTRYFGEKLGQLAKKEVSIDQLRNKYQGKPKFVASITEKVHEAKAEYDRQVIAKGPEWAAQNPWNEVKARAQIETAALESMQKAEALSAQQDKFRVDPASLGEDRAAWEEFANMKGIHRQGTALEPFALSDQEMDDMIKQLPIDIALIAVSGGLGSAAGQLVSGAIMRAGLSAAGREALAFGVSGGIRQFAAYTGGLLVENTVFTLSHAALNSVREGKLAITSLHQFAEEWRSGLVTLGGLGMVGRAGAALKLGKYSSLALEHAGMANLNGGQLTMNDVGIILGLKVGHAAADKVKPAKAPGKAQKKYAELPETSYRAGESAKKLGIEDPAKITSARITTDGQVNVNGTTVRGFTADTIDYLPPAIRQKILTLAPQNALNTHFFSKFSRSADVPKELWPDENKPESAREIEGWTDKAGHVHYNLDFLNTGEVVISDLKADGQPAGAYRDKPVERAKIMPPGYEFKVATEDVFQHTPDGRRVKVASSGDRFVQTPDGHLSFKRFITSPEGKNLEIAMRRILQHEKTHQGLELAFTRVETGTDGKPQRVEDPAKTQTVVEKFAKPDAQGKVPEGKIPLFDKDGKPVKPNWENVQEFLCRVSDGSQRLSVENRAALKALIEPYLPGFDFGNKARWAAGKRLATNQKEAFTRNKAVAKSVQKGAEPTAVQGVAEQAAPVERIKNYEHLEGVLKDEARKPPEQRVFQKILSDFIGLLRFGETTQTEAFKLAHSALVEPQALAHLQERYLKERKIVMEMNSTVEGRNELARMEKAGRLSALSREILRRIKEESEVVRELMFEEKADGTSKSPEEVDASYAKLEKDLDLGAIELSLDIIMRLAQTDRGVGILIERPELYIRGNLEKLPPAVKGKINAHHRRVEAILKSHPGMDKAMQNEIRTGKIDNKFADVLARDKEGRLTPEQVEQIAKGKISQRVFEFLSQADLSKCSSDQIKLLFDENFNKIENAERMAKIFKMVGLGEKVDPIILEIASRDSRNILSDDHFDQLLGGSIDHEKADIMAKNIDKPEFNSEYAEAIILGALKNVTVNGGQNLSFYQGTKVHEGGIGTFHRVAVLNKTSGELEFKGVKTIKDPYNPMAVRELETCRQIQLMLDREKANGNPGSADLFAQPSHIADNGSMLFFEVYEFDPGDGKGHRPLNLDQLSEIPDVSPLVLARALVREGKALGVLHRNKLVYLDGKTAQFFLDRGGGRLGDFGSVMTFDAFTKAEKFDLPPEKQHFKYPLSYEIDLQGNPKLDSNGEPIVAVWGEAYVGSLAMINGMTIGVTPHYYSEAAYLEARQNPEHSWKMDAYSYGQQWHEIISGETIVTGRKTSVSKAQQIEATGTINLKPGANGHSAPGAPAPHEAFDQTAPSIRGSDQTAPSIRSPGTESAPPISVVLAGQGKFRERFGTPHPFKDPEVNKKILEIADKLMDPHDFSLTVEDANAQIEAILNQAEKEGKI